jgi:hypothetical protein
MPRRRFALAWGRSANEKTDTSGGSGVSLVTAMDSNNGFDLDSHLERELRGTVGSLSGTRPLVSQSAYHAAFLKASRTGLRAWLASVASSRAAAGLAVAALAVGGGSIAAAAATGSTNPGVWGKTVTLAVERCKNLGDGVHGIGKCVSEVARQNGAESRAHHSHGNGSDHPTGPPAVATHGSGNGEATGRPSGVPAGPPSTNPSGTKTNPPNGPPATTPGHAK